MAPTKMNDRFEWFLEKCTEIGIDEITPVLCEHSERKKINPERFEKVILSAMKQSLKYTLPRLNSLRRLEDLVASSRSEARLIAHCEEGVKKNLPELVKGKKDILILIGPEGDFAPREIELALSNGFRGLSLGASRLRTETAGVVACSQVSLIKEFL
jgi:16S rRNA (uracil1498-N3)-methyltransferase